MAVREQSPQHFQLTTCVGKVQNDPKSVSRCALTLVLSKLVFDKGEQE